MKELAAQLIKDMFVPFSPEDLEKAQAFKPNQIVEGGREMLKEELAA